MRKWSKVFISRFGINLLVVNRDLYCFTTGLSQRQMREKSRVISPIVKTDPHRSFEKMVPL